MDIRQTVQICDRFEQQLKSESRLTVEQFLSDLYVDYNDRLVLELLRLDLPSSLLGHHAWAVDE